MSELRHFVTPMRVVEWNRRESYEAPLMFETDEDQDDNEDEENEKKQLMAEKLVEQLDECEDMEAEEDKENRPPETSSSPAWQMECLMVCSDARGDTTEKAVRATSQRMADVRVAGR